MSVVSTITCERCEQRTEVSHSASRPSPFICNQCSSAVAAEKRTAELEKIAALPTDERLRRIEAWIYDYRPPAQLRDMLF